MFHIFSCSSPLHSSSWNCESDPKLRKSFIYRLCMAWWFLKQKPSNRLWFPPRHKMQALSDCKGPWFATGMPNLPHEGIRTETALCAGHSGPHETNWMFPTDISWPPHHAIGEACSPLKPPGTDSLPLSGMLPNRPTFSIHYIPSGIPVLCWTHVNGV